MYIMNLSQFTNKQNITLLWEVLLDELCINLNNKQLVTNIRSVFESNIHPFTSRSNPKTHIMELNKQFLSQVVLAVNRLFPNINELKNEPIKRIIIANEELTEPYKIEDIQSSRMSEFEKELERKRMEFEKYMTPQKPTKLDFSYDNLDSKITSMDSLIADKMTQRNLDIEQIHNGNYNLDGEADKWLSSTETSVKNDTNICILNQPINNKLTNINTLGNNVSLNIDLVNNNKKKVTFSDVEKNKVSNINIFEKLKKQTHSVETSVKYEEQKSQPLPEILPEQINRASIVQNSTISQLVPTSEIVKKLNDMSIKLDKLYEIVFNLTNSIEEIANITNKNDI